MEIRVNAASGNGLGKKINVEDLTLDYGPLRVIDHVGFGVQEGEFLAVVGPSG